MLLTKVNCLSHKGGFLSLAANQTQRLDIIFVAYILFGCFLLLILHQPLMLSHREYCFILSQAQLKCVTEYGYIFPSETVIIANLFPSSVSLKSVLQLARVYYSHRISELSEFGAVLCCAVQCSTLHTNGFISLRPVLLLGRQFCVSLTFCDCPSLSDKMHATF